MNTDFLTVLEAGKAKIQVKQDSGENSVPGL